MTIKEIVDFINTKGQDIYFLVPDDIFGHGHTFAQQYAAASVLQRYYHYWKRFGQETTFDVYGQSNMNVWIPSAGEYKEKYTYKISMTNEKLAEFAANMNTIND